MRINWSSFHAGRSVPRPFAALAGVLLAAHGSSERSVVRGSQRSTAPSADTVVVYGPRRFSTPTGLPTLGVERFSVSPSAQSRYIVRLESGSASGGARPTSGSVRLNGDELFSSAEIAAGPRIRAVSATLANTDTLRVSVAGPAGAYVTLTVLAPSDPTFTVFGPLTVERASGASTTRYERFSVSGGAAPPFYLYVSNGSPDGTRRCSSASLRLNGVELLSGAELNQQVGAVTKPVRLRGDNTLAVRLESTPGARLSIRFAATDTTPPSLTILAPPPSLVTRNTTVAVSGTLSDDTPTRVTVNGTPATVSTSTFSAVVTLLADGPTTLAISAIDAAGHRTDSARTVTRDTQPPVLTLLAPADGLLTRATTVDVVGSVRDATATTATVNGLSLTLDSAGNFHSSVALTGPTTFLSLAATDAAGNVSSLTRLVTRDTTPLVSLPPDPVTLAPPLGATTATPFSAATTFLYAGARPLQQGVIPGAVRSTRAAVIRGRVTTRDGRPLGGALISAVGHPELGTTQSRADGGFDFAVNGGDRVGLRYSKPGYLEIHRQVPTTWQDYADAGSAALTPMDSLVAAVDPRAASQIAVSSTAQDSDGARRATLLFPRGTTADLSLPDGTTRQLSTFHVRATEYTVGPLGPAAMPAPLPPTSAYTYAVELSLDEALDAGATAVTFSRAVAMYVDNFLGFSPGTPVPVGSYDRERSSWNPEPNGRVIAVLDTNARSATLDVDGSGSPASPATLATIGVDSSELASIASLFRPGQSFWRATLTHFSPYDLNFPYVLPPLARPPALPPPKPARFPPCRRPGTIIDCNNQVLGEELPVAGTPFTLNYRSDRAPGFLPYSSVEIPLSDDRLPTGVDYISLDVRVAGRTFTGIFPPTPDQNYTFQWDGKDAYGRTPAGEQPLTAIVSYIYLYQYGLPAAVERAFGQPCRGLSASDLPPCFMEQSVGSASRREIALSQRFDTKIGSFALAGAAGVGGWSLDVHHVYDPASSTIHFGFGDTRTAPNTNRILRTVASSRPDSPFDPEQVAVTPDGTIYATDERRCRIVRVDPNTHVLTTAAGGAGCSFAGDSGPATKAGLDARGITVGPNGTLYIADTYNFRIRRVDASGTIVTVAGSGVCGSVPDTPIPALDAQLCRPSHLVAATDGTLYFAYGSAIKRVTADGTMTTVAGRTAARCFYGAGATGCGDDGPASDARFGSVDAMALAGDGSIVVIDAINQVIRRVSPDGRVTRIAGNGVWAYAGDDGPALKASLKQPDGLAVGADGSVYYAEPTAGVVRQITPDGFIHVAAGMPACSPFAKTCDPGFGDGGPATHGRLFGPSGVAVTPDGALIIAEALSRRIRRASGPFPGFSGRAIVIADEAGGDLFHFDSAGRHLRTVDATTGALRYAFTYDSAGRLATIVDADDDTTRIERTTSGAPTAIVAPRGQRTSLALDLAGNLASVSSPLGAATRLSYEAGQLLTGLTEIGGATHAFAYDTGGRLVRDVDPTGVAQTLTRTSGPTSTRVSISTALGRVDEYVTTIAADAMPLTARRFSTGLSSSTPVGRDGSRITAAPDGTTIASTMGADPRFGIEAPTASRIVVTTPSGLSSWLAVSRSVTLATPDDPLSVVAAADSITVDGRSFVSTFDAASRAYVNRTPAGRTASVLLDDRGRPVRLQVPGVASITKRYDGHGRLVETAQGARSWRYTYTPAGALASVTDPLGRATTFSTDVAGRMIAAERPDGTVVRYSVDQRDDIRAIETPRGALHKFEYTPAGQPAAYLAPGDSEATSYSYDADGALSSVGRGRDTITLAYDAGGRVLRFTTSQGAFGAEYDSTTGNLRRLTAPSAQSLAYSFDGPLVTRVVADGVVRGSVDVTYDSAFQVTGIALNDEPPIALHYDADGILDRAGELSVSRGADNAFLLATALRNCLSRWTYDEYATIASIDHAVAGSQLLHTTYERDLLGRVQRATESLGGETHVTTYAYDAAGRLSDVSRDGSPAAHYLYDANGNPLRITRPSEVVEASYDLQDRLLSYGDVHFTYAADGTLDTRELAGAVTRYRYDAVGNLLAVVLPGGKTVTYLIDPRGRRVGKRVNGVLTYALLYQDQVAPAAELSGDGALVTRFVYATHPNVPNYMIRGGVTYRLLTDQLGSVRLVVDATTGEVAQRLDYDERGDVTLDTRPGFQPFGFGGGLYDPDTRLVHFNARDYDPVTGRWTARDPVGFAAGSTNLYEYAGGDPVNVVDPSGWCPTGSDGFAPVGPQILAAADGSGEWRYSQGSSGKINRGTRKTPVWAPYVDPVRNTATYAGGEHIGDCTDFVYWAASRAVPGWAAAHPYASKLGTGNRSAASGFLHSDPSQLAYHGWQRIEAAAARAGDIVVRGGHAGIYVCTDDHCRIWGQANNGAPARADVGYMDHDTGPFDFSPRARDSAVFFRPIAP